jgi:hypothetical protein
MIMEGTRPLTGPALTNDLCSQNVKVNIKINTNAVFYTRATAGIVPAGR